MSGRTRVELVDNRNEGRSLHAAWHPDRRTLVVSHWRGNLCVATTPLALDQVGPLAGLLVGVLAEEAGAAPLTPPSSDPGQPPSLSTLRRDAGRLVRHWTRSVLGRRSGSPAQVVEASALGHGDRQDPVHPGGRPLAV